MRKVGVVVAAVAAAALASGLIIARVGAATADPHAPDSNDLDRLDASALELGTVMVRARGPAAAFARRVHPRTDDDLQIRSLSGSSMRDGAVVVLEITHAHMESALGIPTGDSWPVSACYRWVFTNHIDDHVPQRLDECPHTPVITLPPLPPEPRLPIGIGRRLRTTLGKLTEDGQPTTVQVEAAVRKAYRAAADADEGDSVASARTVLDADAGPVTRHGAIGIALSAGHTCLLIRIADSKVQIWSPTSVQLKPGEVSCVGFVAAANAGHPPH